MLIALFSTFFLEKYIQNMLFIKDESINKKGVKDGIKC